jgi:hypothetical protein
VSTTIPATSRTDLLAKMSRSHRALRDAIGALPPARWEEKLPAGWTLKEMIGHIAYWEGTIPAFVDAIRAGTYAGDGDVDAQNARAASEARGLSRDEVLRRWDTAHAEVVEVARNLTNAELADESFVRKFEGETFGHYPDHYADLGPAIKDKDDLVALVQTPWVGLRLAIAAIGLPALEEKTATGWTYKDLVAHAAAWEDRTAKRLRTFRAEGAQVAVDDTDEFNAAVVERTRGRDARDVVRELDEAHGRILEQIEQLTPEQIHSDDDWVVAIVAGNTYGHYAEHFDEVFAAVPKRPAELAAKMREGWRPFRRALNRLGLTPLSDTSPAGWTYRGMLGHLANWMEEIPAEMPNRLAGKRGPSPDVDAENAREAEAAKTRSSHDAVVRLDAAYQSVVALVNALPADRDMDFLAVRLVVGETYGHFVEHGAEIEAALPRKSGDFVRSIERVWKPFRATIRERGRGGLEEQTATGWTYKNLIAHSIGWMEQTIREMRTGDVSTGWTKETIDAYNERSARTHEFVGAEAIVDELDTVYRNLLATIRGLGDGPVDRRFATTLPFYTYLHWEEHLVELGVPV